ncbi:MAG: RecA domain protein [Acidobacteria bacterium]|jgi:hypothetical protein|nr:RecA domain protein [Acidobacteriota bacterium]
MAEPLARALLSRLEAPLAGRLRTARELVAATRPSEPATWGAAMPELAALLPGGLPRGVLTELAGRLSSGRMGFVLALLAAATSAGENAALVDLGDGLDPQRAAAGGVALERLLWARPRDLSEALAAAEAVVGGGFPLVVVELGLPPVPGGRGRDAQWLRLARAARAAGTVLLVSSPSRRCGVAAGVALALERARPRWSGAPAGPRLLDGVEARLVGGTRPGARAGGRCGAAGAPVALRLAAS